MARTSGRRRRLGRCGSEPGHGDQPGLRRAWPLVLVLTLALASGTAWGFWTAPAVGTGTATTATLLSPSGVTASGGLWSDSVHVAWDPAVTSTGTPAHGYYVTRLRDDDGSTDAVCGTSAAAPTTDLECQDTSVPDGLHHYVVTAVQHRWTAASDASNTFGTDTTAPSITPTSVSPEANANGYQNTGPVTVTLAADDNGGSGLASITYRVDTEPPVTVAASTASAAVSGDGDHTVTYFATDAAGNHSSTANQLVRIDTTAPAVSVHQSSAQEDPANTSPIDFTVDFTEPVTGFTSSDVTVSGTAGPTTAVVSGTGANYSVSVSGMTSDGTVVVAVGANRASDAAGNANTASTSTDDVVTRDNTPPAPPSAPGLTAASDSGTSSSDAVTNDATPTFTGTAEPGATVTLYDGNTTVGSGIASEGSYTLTTATLADGPRTITAEATDAAGNTGTSVSVASITIDTVAPVVTLTSFTASTGRKVTASGTAGRLAGDNAIVTVRICEGTGALGTTQPTFPCTPSAAILSGTVNVATGAWSTTSGALSALTTYYARAEQHDIAGNVGVSPISASAMTGLV